MRGKFIVFEGGEGVGKSTLAKLLGAALVDAGRKVWVTEEPTKENVGPRFDFRRYAFDKAIRASTPMVNAFMFIADRCYHTPQIVERLEAGVDVICDRYSATTFAYQVADNALTSEQAIYLQTMIGALSPNVTIYLRGDIEACLKRSKIADGHHGTFEESTLDFHKRVAVNFANYLMMRASKEPYEVIENVHTVSLKDIFMDLATRLKNYGINVSGLWASNQQ